MLDGTPYYTRDCSKALEDKRIVMKLYLVFHYKHKGPTQYHDKKWTAAEGKGPRRKRGGLMKTWTFTSDNVCVYAYMHIYTHTLYTHTHTQGISIGRGKIIFN